MPIHNKITISTLPNERLDDIFNSLLNDHVKLYITDDFDEIFSTGDIPLITRDILEIYKQQAIDNINKHVKKGKYVIIFIPEEGTMMLDNYLKNFTAEIKKNFLIMGDSTFNNYPFKDYINLDVYLDKTVSQWNTLCSLKYFDSITTTTSRPYTFLLLNKNCRYHRTYIVDALTKNDSLKHALWSYIEKGIVLPQEISDYFNRTLHDTVDEHTGIQHKINHWPDGIINPAMYFSTYFSVVTETNYIHAEQYYTEKIFKPMMMGHPFIVVANKDFYKFFHNAGFKTFGHLIDETFDSIENHDERFDRIADVILNLSNSDLDEFVREAAPICAYNRELLLEKKGKYPLTTHNNLVGFFDRVRKLI